MSLMAAVAAGEAFIGTNGTVNNFFKALTEAVSTLGFFISPFFLGASDEVDLGALSNCFNALTDSSLLFTVVDGFNDDSPAVTMEIFVVEPRILFNAFMETDSFISVGISDVVLVIDSRHEEFSRLSSLSVSETTETVSEVWSDPALLRCFAGKSSVQLFDASILVFPSIEGVEFKSVFFCGLDRPKLAKRLAIIALYS